MKYVLLSDIHGNYPALESVISEEGTDASYLILGDILGLNGFPEEVVSQLQSLPHCRVILGNHDKSVLYYKVGHVNSESLSDYEVTHSLNNLSDSQVEWLKSHSYMDIFCDDNVKICMTHAKPWSDEASGYERGNDGIRKRKIPHIASILDDSIDFVFHGHTHVQYTVDCSKFGHDVRFVNPGSLGYDGNYAIVDTEHNDVYLKTVNWDEQRVKDRISSLLPENAPNVEEWL